MAEFLLAVPVGIAVPRKGAILEPFASATRLCITMQGGDREAVGASTSLLGSLLHSNKHVRRVSFSTEHASPFTHRPSLVQLEGRVVMRPDAPWSRSDTYPPSPGSESLLKGGQRETVSSVAGS